MNEYFALMTGKRCNSIFRREKVMLHQLKRLSTKLDRFKSMQNKSLKGWLVIPTRGRGSMLENQQTQAAQSSPGAELRLLVYLQPMKVDQ